MGSSRQKTETSTMASGPGMRDLKLHGPARVEAQYQADMNDPNRVAPQAQGYLGNVLSGQYLNPASNPHLGALQQSIWEGVAPAVSSVFSRAGRGSSASDSGLGGALTRGFTSAMAQPLFAQYNQERGFQQQAAQMAPAADATASLPLEQYLERMRAMAQLGQRGTSTTTQTPSALQTIAGIGLTAAGIGGTPMGVGAGAPTLAGSLFSDRRLKTDIEPIGDDPRGWGVYTFRYLWDEPGTRHVGVMADEVAPIMPEAVAVHPSGYLMVDYGAL
jgi:hypothetical protein